MEIRDHKRRVFIPLPSIHEYRDLEKISGKDPSEFIRKGIVTNEIVETNVQYPDSSTTR